MRRRLVLLLLLKLLLKLLLLSLILLLLTPRRPFHRNSRSGSDSLGIGPGGRVGSGGGTTSRSGGGGGGGSRGGLGGRALRLGLAPLPQVLVARLQVRLQHEHALGDDLKAVGAKHDRRGLLRARRQHRAHLRDGRGGVAALRRRPLVDVRAAAAAAERAAAGG